MPGPDGPIAIGSFFGGGIPLIIQAVLVILFMFTAFVLSVFFINKFILKYQKRKRRLQ